MGTTQRFQLPYPEESDTPDVPRDIKALADRLEAVLPVSGSYSGSTDAAGYVTVSHGLGRVPAGVIVSSTYGGPDAVVLNVSFNSLTDTSFKVLCRKGSNALHANSPISFTWWVRGV